MLEKLNLVQRTKNFLFYCGSHPKSCIAFNIKFYGPQYLTRYSYVVFGSLQLSHSSSYVDTLGQIFNWNGKIIEKYSELDCELTNQDHYFL